MDFLQYVGAALTFGKPISAAVAGTTSQLMATYTSGLEVLQPLLRASADVEAIGVALVASTYAATNASWAASGDASAALSRPAALAGIFKEAYTRAAAAGSGVAASRRRRLQQAPLRSADELMPLFTAVGNVRCGRVLTGAACLPAPVDDCAHHPPPGVCAQVTTPQPAPPCHRHAGRVHHQRRDPGRCATGAHSRGDRHHL